jgi:hypothetical protein
VELTLQTIAGDLDVLHAHLGLDVAERVINAGKLTPARIISVAYEWRLCRFPYYAARIKTNRRKALGIQGCLRVSHSRCGIVRRPGIRVV